MDAWSGVEASQIPLAEKWRRVAQAIHPNDASPGIVLTRHPRRVRKYLNQSWHLRTPRGSEHVALGENGERLEEDESELQVTLVTLGCNTISLKADVTLFAASGRVGEPLPICEIWQRHYVVAPVTESLITQWAIQSCDPHTFTPGLSGDESAPAPARDSKLARMREATHRVMVGMVEFCARLCANPEMEQRRSERERIGVHVLFPLKDATAEEAMTAPAMDNMVDAFQLDEYGGTMNAFDADGIQERARLFGPPQDSSDNSLLASMLLGTDMSCQRTTVGQAVIYAQETIDRTPDATQHHWRRPRQSGPNA